MKVHHLNCGTMRPSAVPGGLVCHVLLVETDSGLALVDTGLGLIAGDDPAGRFGPARFLLRPAYEPAESAIEQVTTLGFDPRDVRHVILTHFDADHVGGLADFPWAEIHLTSAESQAARHPKSLVEKGRYLPAHRAHGPNLVTHDPARGESWRGFPAALELGEVSPGILLIGLPGHTRGHAAVAVDSGDRWVLHAGDSFYHRGQIDGTGKVPTPLTIMERIVAHDWRRVKRNHERLTELWTAGDKDLLLVNAHDPVLLQRAQGDS